MKGCKHIFDQDFWLELADFDVVFDSSGGDSYTKNHTMFRQSIKFPLKTKGLTKSQYFRHDHTFAQWLFVLLHGLILALWCRRQSSGGLLQSLSNNWMALRGLEASHSESASQCSHYQPQVLGAPGANPVAARRTSSWGPALSLLSLSICLRAKCQLP